MLLKNVAFYIVVFFTFCNCNIHAQNKNIVALTTLHESLKESSALVFYNNGFWTLNDGKSNKIYKIDTANGTIVQTITITNAQFTDAECMATDGKYLYIGDTGNNDGDYTQFNIFKIALNALDTSKNIAITAQLIQFNYPENNTIITNKNDNNFDCEAMIATNNALYVFTKRRSDNRTSVYSIPKQIGKYSATLLSTFNCNGLITDASYNYTTKTLYLLGYQKKHLQSFIWKFTDVKEPNLLNNSASQKIFLNATNNEWQTEGICILLNNTLLLTCEKAGKHLATLYRFFQ